MEVSLTSLNSGLIFVLLNVIKVDLIHQSLADVSVFLITVQAGRWCASDIAVSWPYYVVPAGHTHTHIDGDWNLRRIWHDKLGLEEFALLAPHLREE